MLQIRRTAPSRTEGLQRNDKTRWNALKEKRSRATHLSQNRQEIRNVQAISRKSGALGRPQSFPAQRGVHDSYQDLDEEGQCRTERETSSPGKMRLA